MENDRSQNASEWIIQKISSIRFLADFVFPNPQYHKGRIKRELADLIVAVGGTLIIFQIKTHFAKPNCEHDVERAKRKILEAYRQFRTLVEGFDDKKLKTLRNNRGIDVPFDPTSFHDVHLVALLDYVGDEKSAPIRVLPSGFNDHDLPITFSAFIADDFFFLAHQFDTVRDFTLYLDVLSAMERKMPVLLEKKLSTLVAHFKLYPKEVVDLIEKDTIPVHLTDDVVDEFSQKGDDNEKASYFFDDILSILHSSVGIQMPDVTERFAAKLRIPYNSAEAYWSGLSALADTSRWQRQQIGTLIFEKMAAAKLHGFAFGAVIFEKERKAILVHCSESSFIDRARELGGLALVLIATHEVDSVAGLCMPTGVENGGCAALSLRREWIDDIEGLRNNMLDEPIFSAPRCS